jgi:hypothetical protein
MFHVGDMVVIQSRTWPGINKPGGVGKVVNVNKNTMDVKYTLGGSEKNIEIIYAKLWDIDLTTSVATSTTTARRTSSSTSTEVRSATNNSTKTIISSNKRTAQENHRKTNITTSSSNQAREPEEAKDVVKKHRAAAALTTTTQEKPQSVVERSPKKIGSTTKKNSLLKDGKENRIEQKVKSTKKGDSGDDKKIPPKGTKERVITLQEKQGERIRPTNQDGDKDVAKPPLNISKVASKPSSSRNSSTVMTSSKGKLKDSNQKPQPGAINKIIPSLLPIQLERFIELTSRAMDGTFEMEIDVFLQKVNSSGESKVSEEDAMKYFELMEDRNIIMFSHPLRTLYRIT